MIWWLIIPYILMIIMTARVVNIWFNDPSQPIAAAFCCILIGCVWPAVWLVYFINKGFSNPLKPW